MEFQSLLHKKLYDGVFVFTAETTPPDASNKETLLEKINPLKDVADAINVTDSPGAKVHMSALTAAIILAQNDIDPILQLTVRDRNRLALQGDLVGASGVPRLVSKIPILRDSGSLCLFTDLYKDNFQFMYVI